MLTLPSYETVRDLITTTWQSYRPTADATPYSDLWLFSRILARIEARAMKAIQRGIDALFPTTTWGVYLDRWLYFRGMANGAGGYGVISARGSSGTAALTVTATGASVDLEHYELTDTAGRTYQIDESYSFGGAGTHALDVRAVSTGLATNLPLGAVLTFSAPPANITAAATLAKDLTNGCDLESDPAGRVRLITGLQFPATAGNVADWVETIEAVSPGALKAYCWPQRENQPYGYGCTDYCAFKIGEHGHDRAVGSGDDLYHAIGDAITARIPTLLARNSRQLTMTDDDHRIDVVLTMHPGAQGDQLCDWDAEAVATTVGASVSGTKTITASANVCAPTVTGGIEVGDRVLIAGEEVEVATVNVTADAKIFTVVTWPWTASINSKYLCSGGGCIKTVHDALLAYADSLGPARGTYAAPLTQWDDTLRVNQTRGTVIVAADGTVIDVACKLPGGADATDQAPTSGSGPTIPAINITEITVWELK
jgi:hypothetical protein